MATTVKLEGFRELGRALDELPKATARNVLNRTLTKAASPLEAAMEVRAPKRSGALERSIVTSKKLTGRQARDQRRDGKHFAEVHVGTRDPAGMFQEFGTFKEPAQPWARPAWEQTQDEILQFIGKQLGDEVEKAAARLARKRAKAGL